MAANDPMPSRDDVAKKMAQALVDAERMILVAASEVDCAVAFSCYAYSRVVGAHDEKAQKSMRPAAPAVELAAWLLFPHFGRSTCRDGEKIQAVFTALQEYESAFSFAELFPELPVGDSEDDLSMHLRTHSGVVRGSGYPIQVIKRIHGVLGPLESELAALVGIGPVRASEIVRALAAQVEDNIHAARSSCVEAFGKIRDLMSKGVAAFRPEAEQLSAFGAEVQQLFSAMEGSWSPTREQLSPELGGLSQSEWAAFGNVIGLSPTSRATLQRVVDVQDRPVFFLDEDRAFCVHATACLDAIFNRFDDAARGNASIQDRYGRCVSNWMERTIEDQLRRLFPAASIIRSACFPDPDRPGGETEADVVVIWWPFLIVAEAKGKRVPTEAMRGSREKLRHTIAKNIQDAFVQSRRVVRVLERDGRIQFKEKETGRLVVVEYTRLRRVMPISVTLQNLSGIATQLAVTQRLGLFKGGAFPWSVAIDDLDVITRFAGSPDVFLHYIERRIGQQSLNVKLMGDELDFFGQYLETRLHPAQYEARKEFVGHTSGPNFLAIDGGDEVFEPFYMAEWYEETQPANLVELKVPPEVKLILNGLRALGDDGSRWVAFAMLGLSSRTLVDLAQAMRQVHGVSAVGRRIIRAIIREGDLVINVLAHGGLLREDFHRNVKLRTRLEHYRARARASVSIGVDQRNASAPFDVVQWWEEAWRHDPVIEDLLAKDRETPSIGHLPKGSTKLGRNDLCPCGSGKKFKKCCIDRIKIERMERDLG